MSEPEGVGRGKEQLSHQLILFKLHMAWLLTIKMFTIINEHLQN